MTRLENIEQEPNFKFDVPSVEDLVVPASTARSKIVKVKNDLARYQRSLEILRKGKKNLNLASYEKAVSYLEIKIEEKRKEFDKYIDILEKPTS